MRRALKSLLSSAVLLLACLWPLVVFAQSDDVCDPAPGYREVTLLGEQRDAAAGEEVAVLGDLNGDGIDDYAVHAPFYRLPNGIFGLTYVIYGNPRQDAISLGEIGPNTGQPAIRGFVVEGAGTSGLTAGGGLRPLGDIDGDGIDDFGIADFFALSPLNVRGGAVYLFHGRRDIDRASAFPERVQLAEVGSGVYGDQVRVHYGPGVINDQYGTAIQRIGDLNRDGRDDFMIGLPGTRQVQVHLGNAERPVSLNPVLTLQGLRLFGNFGRALGGEFDFDGDGIPDVLACATNEFNGPFLFPDGNCYLLWGKSVLGLGPEFVVDDLFPERGGDGSLGMVLSGGSSATGLGGESRFIGHLDINGDGRDDLIFGAPVAQPSGQLEDAYGRVYVLYGSAAPMSARITLADLASAPQGPNQQGFVLEGPTVFQGQFGEEVIEAGDVNGDGIDDLLVTAIGGDYCGLGPGMRPNFCGNAYVIYGRRGAAPFAPLTRVSREALEAGMGFRFGPQFEGSTQRFGIAAASLRDFTGDGKPEWLISAHVARVGDGLRGKACLYLSGNGEIIAPPPLMIDAGNERLWFILSAMVTALGGWWLTRRREHQIA